MPLDLQAIANEVTWAEDNIVALEKHDENPLAEDVSIKRSNPSGGYNVLFTFTVTRMYIATLLRQSC